MRSPDVIFPFPRALDRIIIRGQSGGVLVWLSVWSKEQTTLYDLHINSMTYTLFFLFQVISFKKYFYVSLGNNFYCFVEAP